MSLQKYDLMVFGGGAAGVTAAIYLSRARLNVIILDNAMPGGQINLTHAVANYPGIELTPGYKLTRTMRKQAKDFGTVFMTNVKYKAIDIKGSVKKVELEDGTIIEAKAAIIATGGVPRSLGLDSEIKFKGHGISYCATCDGDFFTDQDIIVVGGGNSALEESVALTQYARSVTIIHQFDHFQAYQYAIDEAKANPKISYRMNSEVIEFIGDEELKAVKIINKETNEYEQFDVSGAFILIGYLANSSSFVDIVDINQKNEIITDQDMKTNLPGVFAAGDVRQKKYRQITTAVSDGTIAALSAIEYIYNHRN